MKEITAKQLQKKLENKEEFQLIDIREEHELDICTLNGEHIPMDQILSNVERIRKDVPVIIHCKGGDRAKAVVYTLESRFGMDNIYNLKGGIIAYATEVDQRIEIY